MLDSTDRQSFSSVPPDASRVTDASRWAPWLGALVAVVLFAKWSLLGSGQYEVQAQLQPAQDTAESTRQLFHLPDAEQGPSRGAGGADVETSAVRIQGGSVAFVCRAASAHLAYQHCGELVGKALVAGVAARVLRAPTLPLRPLPYGEWQELALGALLAGLLTGLLALGVNALRTMTGGKRGPARSSPRFSSAPPMGRVFTISPPTAEAAEVPTAPNAATGGGEWAASARTAQFAEQGTPHEGPATRTARSEAREGSGAVSPRMLEQLRSLRDELYLRAAEGCLIVGISAEPSQGELKSQVAAQLALSLAEAGQALVLLLETDFDQPRVALTLGVTMPPFSGFSQQIEGRIDGVGRPWCAVRHPSSLAVLGEGMLRTPGMMYTEVFASAVAELRGQYDLIIADGPVLGSGVDVRAFDDICDGIVFVSDGGAGLASVRQAASESFHNKRFLLVLAP